jgi:hypothetical protein
MAKKPMVVQVKDKMQHGYSYVLTAPTGCNFDPEFRPELTPKQMLSLGVFCCVGVASCAAMIAAQIREVVGRQLGPRACPSPHNAGNALFAPPWGPIRSFVTGNLAPGVRNRKSGSSSPAAAG